MRTVARRVLLVCAVMCACTVTAGILRTAGSTAHAATEAASLDSGAWPMLGHDTRQTGKSPHVGAQTNAVKWTLPTGSTPMRSSAAVGSDGTVYIGGGNSVLYALHPSDGSVKWTRTLGGPVWSSPAISSDGIVFVCCYDGKLYAVNTADGLVSWSATIGVGAYVAPTIGSDGSVYCGSYDSTMYAFNPGGSLKWTRKTNSSSLSCPSIADSGMIYMCNGILYAFDPSDGSVESTFAGDFALYDSPAIGSDGTLYFSSAGGTVYALNPVTRVPIWSHSVGAETRTTPAIDSNGTIYVGDIGGILHALDASDGSQKWSHVTGDRLSSAPAIGADGTVYVGSKGGKVEALNPGDGSVKWSYTTGRTHYASPSIGGDGTVYAACDDGRLYAFGTAETATFELTYNAGANGSIVGSSTQLVQSHASGAAVTAKPNTGYHFVSWSDGSVANPRLDSDVVANLSVTATFAIDTHTITVVTGANGTITPSGLQTVEYGSSRTFAVTPNTGFHIAAVFVDGASVGASSSVTFSHVTADHAISAGFAANPVTLSTKTSLTGRSSVKVNRVLKLSGTVSPRAAPGTVTIFKTRLVGKRWKSAGSAKVRLSGGAYRYDFKPKKTGTWRIVAEYSGGKVGATTYKVSKSKVKSVKVR